MCEKLAQGFYMAATWPGIEPRICDTLVRRSTSKPPSYRIGLYKRSLYTHHHHHHVRLLNNKLIRR